MFNLFSDPKLKEQAQALSGLFQAAAICHELAIGERTNSADFDTSIKSLFELNPKLTKDCYPGEHLGTGRRYFKDYLEKQYDPNVMQAYRYALGLIRVYRMLHEEATLYAILTNRIKVACDKMAFFNDTENPTLLKFLADTYEDTFGLLDFRIQVVGHRHYLEERDRLNKIRAVLLAGIRSVALWEQVGGNLFKLIFYRGSYLKAMGYSD